MRLASKSNSRINNNQSEAIAEGSNRQSGGTGTLKNLGPLPSFTFVDTFAGVGGFRLPLDALGGECVFSSEIDLAGIEKENIEGAVFGIGIFFGAFNY